MTGTDFAPTSLQRGLERLASDLSLMAIFLFGSSLSDKSSPSDVDVLVVYPDGELERAHNLAEAIRELPAVELFDVLAMSESEERELSFVQGEHARRIWPPEGERADR